MRRRTHTLQTTESDRGATPEERHEDFLRENGEWNRKLDEALEEVERAAADLEREARDSSSSQQPG